MSNLQIETKLKLYILVKSSRLTPPQCCVQSCHALAEYLQHYADIEIVQDWTVNHKTIIVFDATEQQMIHCVYHYQVNHKTWAFFKEPDMGNIITAVAFEPTTSLRASMYFNGLKLLA